MTANEDELTQQIASILDKPSVYMGGPSQRSRRLAGEIVDLLRSRASIGPDSERIRDAEQVIADVLECEPTVRNVQDIAAALRAAGLLPGPDEAAMIAFCGNVERHVKHGWGQEGVLRLRLCPGAADPDSDVTIPRWDLRHIVRAGQHDLDCIICNRLRSALSQPYPAQEQPSPSFASLSGAIMRICPRCGDKRCPLANDPQATCANNPAQEQQT